METKEGQKKQQPLPTEKQHLALCFSVIDLGTQAGMYKGNPTSARKIHLTFEIPGEKAVFNEEKGPQCFVVGQEYTFSLDVKANFRKMMDSWIGQAVTELDSEKLKKLLRKPAMIQVIHYTPKESIIKYANIANKGVSVFKRPADVAFPKETENKAIYFDLDNFSKEAFDAVPKWLQEKIMKSPEYKKVSGGAVSQDTASTSADPDLIDDEPF